MVQQVSDYLDGAENPAVYFGISAAECADYIQGLAGAGVDAQIYIADSCTSDAVKGLPESDGVIFELQGYLLDQPELNSDFVNAELAAREAAIEEFGPQTPLTQLHAPGVLRRRVHLPGRQPAAGRAAATSTTGRRSARPFMAVDNYHVVGYRPDLAASTTRPSTSRSAPTRRPTPRGTAARSRIDEAIPDGVIDVTELMVAVEEAYPRG